MAETKTSRSAALANQFEAAQKSFIRLVESLSEEQWWFQGVNTPGIRLNDEDETRRVGVIAHHVASSQPWIMGRIRAILQRIASEVRSIPDPLLDKERHFPTGTMTVEQRIERVLIGHMAAHQASIEVTISEPGLESAM